MERLIMMVPIYLGTMLQLKWSYVTQAQTKKKLIYFSLCKILCIACDIPSVCIQTVDTNELVVSFYYSAHERKCPIPNT